MFSQKCLLCIHFLMYVCVCVCVCVWVCVYACACVCMRVRERERDFKTHFQSTFLHNLDLKMKCKISIYRFFYFKIDFWILIYMDRVPRLKYCKLNPFNIILQILQLLSYLDTLLPLLTSWLILFFFFSTRPPPGY